MNYLLVSMIGICIAFFYLWRRSERLRRDEKNEMIGCFAEKRAEKIKQRKEEFLKFNNPNTGSIWNPYISWELVNDPYFIFFKVIAPKTHNVVAEFDIDFHNPLNYVIHFRDQGFLREESNNFHHLLRKYVEASAPWNIEKQQARLHKSKSPDKSGDSQVLAASAGQ